MLIQLIQNHAEERFLEALQGYGDKQVNRCVLFCAFSSVPLTSGPDNVLPFLKDILLDLDAEIYWCSDGDMVVCWRGSSKKKIGAVVAALSSCFKDKLAGSDPGKVFRFFDAHANGEDLRLLFRRKLQHSRLAEKADSSESLPVTTPPPSQWKPEFSNEQMRALREGLNRRASRREPEILVVEDQDFSRKLLVGMFERNYCCYSARNAEEAAAIYAVYAPDMAFLDVELPDADGHALAGLFKKHDPESFIVMVTGNNYVKDVVAAKANNVQGFIVKPYNKLKIMSTVDVFMNKRKKR